ncbi:hypothetical protein [Gracilibacillus orientalis]|uniref:hypothetical protein n=1 Tax=Gracilibacillus orientalis TaxID=334253 RepID=UPI001114669A|nr:hypothetical protein [Gracilibacillus orientalis]
MNIFGVKLSSILIVYECLAVVAEKCDTPGGIARAEDPLGGKVIFFTKLAEAVPSEREYFSAATIKHSSKKWMKANLKRITPQFIFYV